MGNYKIPLGTIVMNSFFLKSQKIEEFWSKEYLEEEDSNQFNQIRFSESICVGGCIAT